MKLSNSDVYDVLSAIKHPEIQGNNLLELGMIPAVDILKDQVKVTLALPSLDVPIKKDLMERIQQAIEKIDDKIIVKIEVVEMDADQQAAFKAMARGAKNRPRIKRQISHPNSRWSHKGMLFEPNRTHLFQRYLVPKLPKLFNPPDIFHIHYERCHIV